MLGGSEKHMEIPNYAISRSLTNNWIKEKKGKAEVSGYFKGEHILSIFQSF